MKRIALLAAGSALVAIPAIIGLSASQAATIPAPVQVANTQSRAEVHGVGHGADDVTSPAGGLARHAEPGDDNGGVARQAEPGDDNGGVARHAEPGDDDSNSNRGPGSGNSGSRHGGSDDGPHHR